MPHSKILKLGTRRSLLAITQSTWVAREVERLNPDVKVELVGMETKGDLILDVPLSKVDGKEFFVKELDDALLQQKVDFCVHSMKDLSLDRPAELMSPCTPKRENPRDVVVFHRRVWQLLQTGARPIKVGTSAPRRLENLPGFLKQALPRLRDAEPQLKFSEIRGNVNTRLSKLHEPEGSEKAVDAVVLALAGLNRLMGNPESAAALKPILENTNYMVLPLSECPAAPAQGILAIECRRDDLETQKILAKLHHEPTKQQAQLERAKLAEWGGGCHQSLGATARTDSRMGTVLFVKGRKFSGEAQDLIQWNVPAPLAKEIQGQSFSSSSLERKSSPLKLAAEQKSSLAKMQALFLAHSKAMTEDVSSLQNCENPLPLFVSGATSWFKLASQGYWVNGAADGLGSEPFLETLMEPWFRFGSRPQIGFLTHNRAAPLETGPGLALTRFDVYVSVLGALSQEQAVTIRNSKVFYWSSAADFLALEGALPAKDSTEKVYHSCGPGRTAEILEKHGIKPMVFPSEHEWSLWLKK